MSYIVFKIFKAVLTKPTLSPVLTLNMESRELPPTPGKSWAEVWGRGEYEGRKISSEEEFIWRREEDPE